ncbi:acyl-CoA thioesterase [Jannaschia aquimarina]|uniref:YbgC_1 protein n=1 Tax=Jannaschia aquimarina TaxID=935700 RepID=A0A0D1EHJ7_9RHOB|nr:thioesterase family protein [Jannaschia aquimarina]KIT17159.1 Acyl-CoA thioester hydrolase YbgC [Jannaschia aquimarina]SNT17543.1 acyl-CoA thioester hydrolase [Jannaschia aquimarina]
MSLPLLTPLDVPSLRAEGVPEPFVFGQADRVRFRELDVLDHVNNAVYLGWFETLRIAYLRAYGIGKYDNSEDRPALILKRVGVEYHRPLHLEDIYVVAGRTRAFRRTSWTMEYRVYSKGQHCTTGEAIICLMEPDFVTRRPLPDAYVETFETRDGAVRE